MVPTLGFVFEIQNKNSQTKVLNVNIKGGLKCANDDNNGELNRAMRCNQRKQRELDREIAVYRTLYFEVCRFSLVPNLVDTIVSSRETMTLLIIKEEV